MSVSSISTSATTPPSLPLDLEPLHSPERQQQPISDIPAIEKGTDKSYRLDHVPTQFIGKGEADTQRSPPFSSPRHKKSPSSRLNAAPKEQKAPRLLVEDVCDKDGERLTSLAWDDKPKPHRTQTELVSGRRAGASWDRSHIHFAPISVPLKRRLQTLMVLSHTLSIALFLTAFFLLCAIPLFWPLLFPYTIYVLLSAAPHSGTLAHRSPFLRSLPIWSLFASYFPARLHRSARLEPTRKYIFGYHPHGIISHGAFATFATEACGFSTLFPGITNTLLTLDSNFRVPFYRDYALAMGLASVSRESCENILSKGGPNGEGMGRAITIVIGGARESLDAQPRSDLRLVLKRRKGFVKLGIRTGADLVPVLAFGENELYEQVTSDSHPLVHQLQLMVKKCMGFTIPLFHARGVFNYDVGLMPYRRPLNVVVGRPVKVVQARKGEKVDEAYVDEIHAAYVTELERIWEEWRGVFGVEKGVELRIVE
ncbi:diacylglycerol O-acyltransferase 1 [Xanthoria calcicola]